MTSCASVRWYITKAYRTNSTIYHQSRTFLFGSPQYTKYEKCGKSIEIGDNDFILDEDFSPHYNPKKDVIIRNYSSSITPKNVEHLMLPFNELTQKRLFYTNFSGIIEYVPNRYRSLYKIGDRVWGIKPHYKQRLDSFDTNRRSISSLLGFKRNPYGHNNAWSDYLSADIRCISHLPANIPLEYGGLFGTDLLSIFDGIGRINWYRTKEKIEGKKVLIIGSGRQCLLNILIPLLQTCNVEDIVIVSSHKRHNKVLTKFNVKSIIDRNNFVPNKHKLKYDIIIDSLSITPEQIEKNVILIDENRNKTEYWVLRNPYNQILMNAETRSDVLKGIFPWNKNIVRSGKKQGMHDVLVKPIRYVVGSGGFKAFSYWLQLFSKELEHKANLLKYPIIVDRLYKLTDIQHALEYCMNYDIEDGNFMLGENVGLIINKLAQNEMIQNDPKMDKIEIWKPYQLLDVDNYERTTSVAKAGYDENEFVDDI